MLNKKWSSLNEESKSKKLKRGHFGECFAAMQLMLHGFEVYKPLVDDRGIDFIIRKPEGVFLEIQVKSITGYDNIKITRNKFKPSNEHLYLVAVQFVKDDVEPEMYIIPATRWAKPDTIFYDSGEKIKKPQYGLRLYEQNCDSLQEYKLENYIDKIS
jgi:hypothetical protein